MSANFRPCGGIHYINMQKFDDTGKLEECAPSLLKVSCSAKAIGLTGKWCVILKSNSMLGLANLIHHQIFRICRARNCTYVGNLDFKVDEKDLSGAFAGCGEIQEITATDDGTSEASLT